MIPGRAALKHDFHEVETQGQSTVFFLHRYCSKNILTEEVFALIDIKYTSAILFFSGLCKHMKTFGFHVVKMRPKISEL